ncbi:hypothetical protein TNCV_3009881 [Trichonephila clavipes]|nr:hypothetical protein TNCV_3009881 [Trichonephila clavipes]
MESGTSPAGLSRPLSTSSVLAEDRDLSRHLLRFHLFIPAGVRNEREKPPGNGVRLPKPGCGGLEGPPISKC